MGNSCSCSDDVDNEGEVKANNRGNMKLQKGAGVTKTSGST